jgi:peroxiredoxin
MVLLTLLCAVAAAHAQNVSVGQAAPDFTLTGLDNQSVSLSQHAGKVIFLDFFGST